MWPDFECGSSSAVAVSGSGQTKIAIRDSFEFHVASDFGFGLEDGRKREEGENVPER